MKIKFFILRPVSPLVSRIKIEIPSGMKVIDSPKPRLSSIGNMKVTTAAVHDGSRHLSGRSMSERARKLGESPIDNLQDLEEALTRGLSVGCDYLVTGIRLRRSFGLEYMLYLSRLANRWIVHFSWLSLFNDDSRVLCYGK